MAMSRVSGLSFFYKQLQKIHHSGINVKDKDPTDIKKELDAKATKMNKENPSDLVDKSSLMKIKADVVVKAEIIASKVAEEIN